MNTNTRNLPIPQCFIEACLGNHITDNSWGNDMVDFIWGIIDHKWVRLGIDYEERLKREEPDWDRYTVSVYDISDDEVTEEVGRQTYNTEHRMPADIIRDEVSFELAMDASTSGGHEKEWSCETEADLAVLLDNITSGDWREDVDG